MVNYETLLKKYMQHVLDCEGVDFVDYIGDYMSDVEFTPEEKAEVQLLAKALRGSE